MEPVRTIEIFQNFPSPKTFVAGDVIFREGEPGKETYGIIEGNVNILVKGKLLETIEKGDVFGEGALIQPEHTRGSTAIANTDCTLAFLDRSHFLFAIEQTPMFAVQLLKSYSDRLRSLRHMLVETLPNS
ncbi:MAG: cyclic nucleotide-binding domain-containing protein [Prochloraceae cyanobacterium]|nr:cyclic nucleotide-binding domain-containing protein [Prochloraceae cyanobacterium]